MDSSPVLRQQSQNQVRSDIQRMKNENNKTPGDPKPLKPPSHLSKKQSENQDPGSSNRAKKTPMRPGVSWLPVLAKSLHRQTPSDFTRSHCRWEEKPLAGKAKKKKPCSRPVPFQMSQHRSCRPAMETPQTQTVLQAKPGAHTVQPDKNVCNFHLKNQNRNAKTSKHPAMVKSSSSSGSGVSSTVTGKSHGPATGKTSQLSGESEPANTCKTKTAARQNVTAPSARPAVSAESCVEDMNQLSLKDPSQNTQRNIPKGPSDNVEKFQPDHSALLSILQNEGVSTAGLRSAALPSKPYPMMPQRVSVMKSRQRVGPASGSGKLVPFTPDASALRSILLNEGVKALGATPRNSVCPSGRGTSIYTAQRVPVRKLQTETSDGPAVTLKETPLKKWTPQRVHNTRRQPMSSMKWHQSTQRSPSIFTPGPSHCDTNRPHQEEVVQRLFEDQEDDLSSDTRDPEQLPVQASNSKALCKEPVVTTSGEGQPFIQPLQRESVIFFSTGKKLLRAAHFEKQESHQDQHGPLSTEQGQVLQVHEGTSSVREPRGQISPAIHSLHQDRTFQRACVKGPAAALLRKRRPLLEELRLDEEVATYTSFSGPAASGFLPPRPRCGNPLATTLHFEESTRFVPISLDVSGSSCPLGVLRLQC